MLPSVTQILSDDGIGFNMEHLPEEYSERGTLIHSYAEAFALEHPKPEIPDKWAGFARGVDKFFCDTNPRVLLTEPELSHPFMGFQGHPDLVGFEKGVPTIWDYKTGSIPEYCGPQLAGYEMLLKFHPKTQHINGWQRIAVLLKPNGKYQLKVYKNKTDHAVFLEAYHNFLKRGGVEWRL